MASAFVPCDLCFRDLARVNIAAAKLWLYFCSNLTKEHPYLVFRYKYTDEKGLLELLEKKALIVTHEGPDLNLVAVKLVGFCQRTGSICSHKHQSLLNPHSKE